LPVKRGAAEEQRISIPDKVRSECLAPFLELYPGYSGFKDKKPRIACTQAIAHLFGLDDTLCGP
jgi:hypothetical protein